MEVYPLNGYITMDKSPMFRKSVNKQIPSEGRYRGEDASLMRQTRLQFPGATLDGQAGHYSTPAFKGMS